MNAKKIMDFAEQHASDENMFNDLEEELDQEKYDVLLELESDPNNKTLNRQYVDICEKQRMVHIMRQQRLELFLQAQKHGIIN